MASVLSQGLRPAGILQQADRPVPVATPDEVAASGLGEFGRGLRSAKKAILASDLRAQGLQAEIDSDPQRAQAMYDMATEADQAGAIAPPRVRSLRDVNSVRDAVDFAAGGAPQAAVTTAPVVAGALAGRVLGGSAGAYVGGAIPAFQMERNETIGELAQDEQARARHTPQEIQNLGSAKALVNSALEVVGPGYVVNKLLGGARGGALRTLRNTMAAESATEASQQIPGDMATSYARTGTPTVDPMNVADAAALGAMGGGMLASPAVASQAIGGALDTASQKAAIDSAKIPQTPLNKWMHTAGTGDDSSVRAVVTPQEMPEGEANEVEWLVADDARRNAAAASVAQRYAADPATPEEVRRAAEDFLAGEQTGDAWAPFSEVVRTHERANRARGALDKLTSGFKNAKRGIEDGFAQKPGARRNAQTTVDPFDRLFARSMYEQIVGDDAVYVDADLATRVDAGVPVVRSWIQNGFKDKNGEIEVPDGVDEVFADPVNAVQTLHALMRRQGLADEQSTKALTDVIAELQNRAESRKDVAQIIRDNLTPTAEESVRTTDLEQLAWTLRDWIEHGNERVSTDSGFTRTKTDFEAVTHELFGPNKERALEALRRTVKARAPVLDSSTGAASLDEDAEGSGERDAIEGMTDEVQPNEVKAKVRYTGSYDTRNEGSAAGLKKHLDDYKALGYDAKAVSVVDKLRAETGEDQAAFEAGTRELLEKYGADAEKIMTIELTEASDKRDPIDIPGSEFAVRGTWELQTGRNNEHGGPEKGVLWFHRVGDKRPMAISASRLITRMRQGMKDVGGSRNDGVIDQHDMLLQGISSILSSKKDDGSAVFDGRVGVMENGEVKWLGADNKLPDTFKLPTGTVADVRPAKTDAHNKKLVEDMTRWADNNEDARVGEVAAVRKALKEKNYDRLEKLRSQFIKDDFGVRQDENGSIDGTAIEPRSPMASAGRVITSGDKKGVADPTFRDVTYIDEKGRVRRGEERINQWESSSRTEVEVMAEAAEQAERSKLHDVDEHLDGLEVQPKPSAREAQTTKQVAFLLDTLRIGIPAFSAAVKQLAGQRKKLLDMRQLLRYMVESTDPKAEVWHGRPPKDMAAIKARADKALEILNTALDKPEPPGGGRRQNAQAPKDNKQSAHGNFTQEPLTAEQRAKIVADVQRRLGPQVAVEFGKIFGTKNDDGFAQEISGEWMEDLIRISINAESPTQIGAHESMHGFFSRTLKSTNDNAYRVLQILQNAASSKAVVRQLERLLIDHPAALEQIKEGSLHFREERLAYMFQFWQAGLLTVGPETKTVFQKIADFFRRVIGLLSEDQKAVDIMRAFEAGEMQTADAAAKVLAENIEYRERILKDGYKVVKPLLDKAAMLITTSEEALVNSKNPALVKIAHMFKNPTGESGVEQSYYEAHTQQQAYYMNQLNATLEGKNPKDVELALRFLREGDATKKRPQINDKIVGEIYDGVRTVLDDMYDYMSKAGVRRKSANGGWESPRKVNEYFPHAFDISKIGADPAGFVKALLDRHTKELTALAQSFNRNLPPELPAVTAASVAESIMHRMVNSYGQLSLDETEGAVGFSPLMSAVNSRDLTWLDTQALADYMNDDLVNVMATYIVQGTKRAEYTRRFGPGGEGLRNMMEEARRLEMERLVEERYGIKGVLKTMKDDAGVKTALRHAKGDMSPAEKTPWLERFAKAAGLELDQAKEIEKDALESMGKYGREVMALEGTLGYDINPTMRRLSSVAVVYENFRLLALSLFSQFIDPLGIAVRGGTMKEAWEAYLRGLKEIKADWTGKQSTDFETQVAEYLGTVDSAGFLANFGQLHNSMYLGGKARKLNEALFRWNGMDGFNRGIRIQATQAAIQFLKRHKNLPDGDTSKGYLEELNLTPDDISIDADGNLNYDDPKIREAVFRWVNGAVLRPNAGQRPSWMSDPHYMIFAHMKQFSFAFHDTILKRVWRDAKRDGNLAPAAIMLSTFVPTMIAADTAKALIFSAGTEPAFMQQGLGDTVAHGINRAGLFGKYQPLVEVFGPNGDVGLAGPTIEHAVDAFTQPLSETLQESLPGASAINTMQRGWR